MDFISNLIKRPISLVLNETSSTTMDKYPISASLPNTSSELVKRKDLTTSHNEDQKQTNINHNKNNKQPLSTSTSCNYDNMTDFIGVPEEFLDEFKDILPPPPLPLQNSNLLNESLLDIDITRSFSITPPPPPPLTPSMKASQTVDELLAQINDDLLQAGLNDDVLCIGSPPPNNSELSPLSSKTALNNSKVLASYSSDSNTQQNICKTSAAAAGSVSSKVFENESSVNKSHTESESENCEHKQQQQPEQFAIKDELNNSGVNKSSNKFVGLTEFDEAKIPELPGDLNPNIEEQYNITFEKCFMPTLNIQQDRTVADEFTADKTCHVLMPAEMDVTSSDNETFSDCNDERDPLASTFAEPTSLDVTELESYQSAVKSLNSTFNNTMDNIADITMQAEGHTLKNIIQNQMFEQPQTEQIQAQFESMDVDEPMDIDMNSTMEIIHNTSNNIEHVERVLQHAENILQHLEDKKCLSKENTEDVLELLEKQTESSENRNQHQEIEHNMHDILQDKNVQFGVDKANNINNECVIENLNKQVDQEENITSEHLKIESDNNINFVEDVSNISNINNSSTRSAVDSKPGTNLTLNLNNSVNSQKSSPPSSPSFPLKTTEITGFPRSPKSVAGKQVKSLFLEKSDYLSNLEIQAVEESVLNNINGACDESSNSENLDANHETSSLSNEKHKRRTFVKDTFNVKSIKEQEEHNEKLKNEHGNVLTDTLNEDKMDEDKRHTFIFKTNEIDSSSTTQFPAVDKINNNRRTFVLTDTPSEDNMDDNKCRTFISETNENASTSAMQFSTADKTNNTRRTFVLTDTENSESSNTLATDGNSRHTFNLPSEDFSPKSMEATDLSTSLEPKYVDDHVSKNTTMSLPTGDEQKSESSPLADIQQNSQSQGSESPSLSVFLKRSQSPQETTTQQDLPLQIMEISSQSSVPICKLPGQQRSSSPPQATIEPKSQSPPLPTGQSRYESTHLPHTQHRLQSPLPSATQPRSQSPPLPSMQNRSQSPPTMQPRTASPSDIIKNQSETQPNPKECSAQQTVNIKKEKISPPLFESTSTSLAAQPLPKLIQKRPSIRDARARAADILSEKEQSNTKVKDEKDVLVEKLSPSPTEEVFTGVSATSTILEISSGLSGFDQTSSSRSSVVSNGEQQTKSDQIEDEFNGNNLILNASDFDYLLTKGNNNAPVDRSSLLLKFDPLLGVPVPVNQAQKIPSNTNNLCLSPTLEEEEHSDSNRSIVLDTKPGASAKLLSERSQEVKQQIQLEQKVQQYKRQLSQGAKKKNATMSVDVIKDMSLDNDCNKTFENSNSTQSDDKQINYKMDELEKKIKNEVLKTEDIEKKLKDAEQREEALIKRITEKDKTIAKMTGVIEAYEKAIAELIADKEQLTQHYEKQLAEVKSDRDSNYHHLTSLETTFSDLHVKYEKSKEMTCQLKESEEALQAEKRKNLENLHLQEQRYDKMKNHAMQQLEIANKKLESLTREHSIELTKLKALLKKEEIARSSINEQLAHKTKENAELVKICDELISGQGSNFSFEPFDPKKH